MITGLFRDMHEYQFPAWKDHKVSFIFCTKLAREQSSSLSQVHSVANSQHQPELMGRGLQGCPEGPLAKAAPIQGAGSQSLVKQILHHGFSFLVLFPPAIFLHWQLRRSWQAL